MIRNVSLTDLSLAIKTPKEAKSLRVYVSRSQKKPSKGYHDLEFEVITTC